MRILVTGAAGFIGSNFYKKFKEKYPKSRVIGIDDFSTGRRDAVDKSLILHEGSITDEKLLEKIFSKHRPEYIFHFAAIPRVSYSVEHPLKTAHANICGTVALLEKAKKYKTKRFIMSSSSSVYGGAKKLPTKEAENLPDPKSPYAVDKYADEMFCKLFSQLFKLDSFSSYYSGILVLFFIRESLLRSPDFKSKRAVCFRFSKDYRIFSFSLQAGRFRNQENL